MNYIKGYPVDDIVLEGVTAMMRDQPSNGKYKYMEAATEAILNPAGKSKMIQSLYADILSKSNIDYGKIPMSKGDLTKYEYYDNLSKSIEALNTLLENQNIEEITLLNKLHDMIITCRSDFEFGFKFDIEFIKLTYNTMVMTLHEMINLSIVAYVNYLKEVKQVDFQFKTFKRSDRIVIKSVEDFLKSYEKGEWTKLMLHFKKNSSNLLGLALTASTAVGVAAIAILGTLALLFSIRALIYIYYNSAMKISQYLSIQAEFLKVAINNTSDTSATSLEKQRKMLSNLESIVSTIETKILKTEKDAQRDMKSSNSTNFSLQELNSAGDTIGVELL